MIVPAYFWDPHQGLWNRSLSRLIASLPVPGRVSRGLRQLIIGLDTGILLTRALCRRVEALGACSLIPQRRLSNEIPVVYLDLGTHGDAKELRFMVEHVLPRSCPRFEAYGFEASEHLHQQARELFEGNPTAHTVHAAVCYERPASGRIRLYKDSKNGLGNSIHIRHRGEYEEAPAIRLSDWLHEKGFGQGDQVILLRMNVEGAELDVIRDLVAAGLLDRIEGYFGMWDDVNKSGDRTAQQSFAALLREHHIRPFTFNGRDFKVGLLSRVRRACIEYEVVTRLFLGARRVLAHKRRRPGHAELLRCPGRPDVHAPGSPKS